MNQPAQQTSKLSEVIWLAIWLKKLQNAATNDDLTYAVTTVVTDNELAKHLSWSSHLEGYKEKNKCVASAGNMNRTKLY